MNKARNRSSAKERIIKAYLRLLTQGKYRKVTVSAVAKAAECNRDTFYYYFASIDALAKCALDELAPASVPHIAVALAEGNALAIPEQARYGCASSPRSPEHTLGFGSILKVR